MLKNPNPVVNQIRDVANHQKGLQKIYGEDGVHPNLSGYPFMEPLVEAGIAKALKRK